MMALSLVACGGSSDTTSDSTDSAAGNTEEPVTLTAIVAGLTEDSPSGEALKKFAELCNEYSGGSVTIDCFFNTELGNVSACVESTAQGTIDIVSTGTSYFAGYVPAIQVLTSPMYLLPMTRRTKRWITEPGKAIAVCLSLRT